MQKDTQILPGILKAESCELVCGNSRVIMLSHAAAVTPSGATAVDWFMANGLGKLVGVMGPEHGFLGHAPAGVPCRSFRHPVWRLPVYSLYGKNRAPKRDWLRKADVLLVDLQDLGYRPYTYVSTLLLAMQAAAHCGMPVVVADRPIPLPHVVDGPMLDPRFESFVGRVAVPLCYGMTPGEMARWIHKQMLPDLPLTVLPMEGFSRKSVGLAHGLPWVSPSPSIRSPETAVVYPATVGLEGLPHIDHGRFSVMPFQLIGAPWIEPQILAELLMERALPGVAFHPYVYVPAAGRKPLPGVRLAVLDARSFRPIEVFVHLLHVLTLRYGRKRVWMHPAARPDFFDQLMGTDRIRTGLSEGVNPAVLIQEWTSDVYLRQRRDALLYR
ncbi:MAG: exo-beta-N-acetylmuramidase NamZ domain-containing protein [Kiritimatiellia bacterium]